MKYLLGQLIRSNIDTLPKYQKIFKICLSEQIKVLKPNINLLFTLNISLYIKHPQEIKETCLQIFHFLLKFIQKILIVWTNTCNVCAGRQNTVTKIIWSEIVNGKLAISVINGWFAAIVDEKAKQGFSNRFVNSPRMHQQMISSLSITIYCILCFRCQ